MSTPVQNDAEQPTGPILVKLTENPVNRQSMPAEIKLNSNDPQAFAAEITNHDIFVKGFQSVIEPEVHEEFEEVIIPHIVERVFAVPLLAPQVEEVDNDTHYTDDPVDSSIEYEQNMDPEVIKLERTNEMNANGGGRKGRFAGQVDDGVRDELANQLDYTHLQNKHCMNVKYVDRVEYVDEVIEVPTKIQQDKIIYNIIEQEVNVNEEVPVYYDRTVVKKYPVVKVIEKPVTSVRDVPTYRPRREIELRTSADNVIGRPAFIDYIHDVPPPNKQSIKYEDEVVYFDRVIERPVRKPKELIIPTEGAVEHLPKLVIKVPKDKKTEAAAGPNWEMWNQHNGKKSIITRSRVTPDAMKSIFSTKSVVNGMVYEGNTYIAHGVPIEPSAFQKNPALKAQHEAYEQSMVAAGTMERENPEECIRSQVHGTTRGMPSTRTVMAPPPKPEDHIPGHTHAYTQFLVPMASQVANVHTAYLPAQYAHNVRLSAPEVAHAVMADDNQSMFIVSKQGPARITPQVDGGYNAVPFSAHLQGHGQRVDGQTYPVPPVASLYSNRAPSQFQQQQYQ